MALVALLASTACLLLAAPAGADTFVVNSNGDGSDANAGNGTCATGGGSCTLRAAVQEANALAGADAVTVPAQTTVLGSTIEISSAVTVTGAGASSTVVDADGNQGFNVTGGPAALRELTVTGGSEQNGGAIFASASADLEVADARLTNNFGFSSGGAIVVLEGGEADVVRTTIENNTSLAFGGGAANFGTLRIRDSLITGNEGNRVGGVVNAETGELQLRNTTIDGNTIAADSSIGTGGLLNDQGFAFLNNVTLTGNEGAGVAGGSHTGGVNTLAGATTVVKNSIIADNEDPSEPPDCRGELSSDSRYNLLEETDGCDLPAVTPTWVLGEDPQLGALQNNGGPTETRLPAFASPVVDAGYPFPPGGPAADSCEATDQRGTQRLLCDMGAAERFVAVPDIITVTTTVDGVDTLPGDATCAKANGNCSLRAAVQEANRLPGAQTIRVAGGVHGFTIGPAEDGFDPARGGDLDLTDDVTIEPTGDVVPAVDANDLSRAFDVSPGTTATLRGLTLRDGTDSTGGGARVQSGTLNLEDVLVRDNVASLAGGGIDASGLDPVLTITDSTIRNNDGGSSGGGGIETSGPTTVTDSVVRDNETGGSGGGIRVLGGPATFTRSTVSGNDAGSNGGGISGLGLAIEATTVSGNSSGTQGGGVFGSGTLVNTTLSGNAAGTNGGGASTSGTLTLTHVTVAANTAATGGRGLHRFGSGSQLSVRNSILADPGGTECAGLPIVSLGDTIAADASCALGGPGDLPSTDALIQPLADYGGPTRTHKLMPGSPALNAATSAGLATDQRGVVRPQGAAPDIGSVEGTANGGVGGPAPSLAGIILTRAPVQNGRLAVALPPAIRSGDLLVVAIAAFGARPIAPPGWRTVASGPAGTLVIVRTATGQEAGTLPVDVGSATRATAVALRIIGQTPTHPVLDAATAIGIGSTASGHVKVPAAPALVLGFEAALGAGSATPPDGWTEVADITIPSRGLQASLATRIVNHRQTVGARFKLARPAPWATLLVAVRR